MQKATQGPTEPGRARRRRRTIAFVALVTLSILASGGCKTMWRTLRESERNNAANNARTQAQRGQCIEALASLDRAQARMDLGGYARESTLTRSRCYEKLGLQELASGHRRMITDFYTVEPFAYPAVDGSSVFRAKDVDPLAYSRPPSVLEIPPPRYTPYASRSKIVGRVVVSFELSGNGRASRLRVLEMPHPLIATWTLEALRQATLERGVDPSSLPRGGKYIATFFFEWRWAEQDEEEES